MLKLFENISIKYRLAACFSLLFILTLAVAGGVVYSLVRDTIEKSLTAELTTSTEATGSMVQTAATVSVRNRLRAIAEKNLDVLWGLEKEVRSGTMTGTQAKQLAEKILLSQTIGETGYIFALGTDGILSMHPRGMQKRDISGEWLSQTLIKLRQGYLEYDWANPSETTKRPKALYMDYFAPWDWIVAVTAYREEFPSLVDIEDFRSSVESFRLGDSGYLYILTGGGHMVLHPWLKGDVSDMVDAEGFELFKEMLARRNGVISYMWKDTPTAEPREKMAVFRFIPELNWVVASSSYLDEIYAPLEWLRAVMLIAAVCVLLLILPLSLYLGASFTRPLSRLAEQMEVATAGDLSVRAESDAPGEIGNLVKHFNEYMVRLSDYRSELRNEIDERIHTEQQLKLFEMVFKNALEGISITDVDGKILAINPAFTDITGYEPHEVMGQNPRVLKSERHSPEFYSEMWASIKEKGSWAGEIWNRRKNGESYPEILSISAIREADGEISHYVAVFHDISDMKLKDEQIEHQVYHDGLTGLPNRILVLDRLSVSISHARRKKNMVAVFYLDVDDFKDVNDSLGHAQGDRLIQAVAQRLMAMHREQDTVARLGGDEFLVMCVDVEDEHEVVQQAERLLSVFDEPFMIKGHELFMTTSIGVTLYPDDGEEPATLIRNADVAMYQSKAKGKNNYLMFTQEMNERISRRLTMERDLRQALVNGEFTVYFQPKVNPFTSEVAGVEALVRWLKSDGSVVSPFEFIPLAEQTGLIVPLGEFVLEASCKAMQVLDGAGCQDLTVSVNLSPLQFKQEGLVEMVFANLERNGLSSSKLELEITESTLMTNIQDSVSKLNELVDRGVSISIDDFGTGYSSLYYLKNFPINVLKIDQSFVRDITQDIDDAQIVETIILMARNLGIDVVAEGVETGEQLELLKTFGCGLVQGYYYSRPLPLDELIEFIRGEDGTCVIKA